MKYQKYVENEQVPVKLNKTFTTYISRGQKGKYPNISSLNEENIIMFGVQ